jgi:hypothetical protein
VAGPIHSAALHADLRDDIEFVPHLPNPGGESFTIADDLPEADLPGGPVWFARFAFEPGIGLVRRGSWSALMKPCLSNGAKPPGLGCVTGIVGI